MGRLVDDCDYVWDPELLCQPAGHQVDRVIARRGDHRVGPVHPRLLENRLVGCIAGYGQYIVVLEDFAAPGLVLVDYHNGMGMFHCHLREISPDTAESYDDDVHAYRLPSPAFKIICASSSGCDMRGR